jgi:hypothetical protein
MNGGHNLESTAPTKICYFLPRPVVTDTQRHANLIAGFDSAHPLPGIQHRETEEGHLTATRRIVEKSRYRTFRRPQDIGDHFAVTAGTINVDNRELHHHGYAFDLPRNSGIVARHFAIADLANVR